MPKGRNLKEIQDQVVQKCRDYIRFHKVKDRPRPVRVMLDEERPLLMPLPLKPFSAYDEAEAKVAHDLTFRYDTTKYSTPQEYIGKTVTVRFYLDAHGTGTDEQAKADGGPTEQAPVDMPEFAGYDALLTEGGGGVE